MQDKSHFNQRKHRPDSISGTAALPCVEGEVLYEPSCPDVPLFIVLDGTVSISRAGEVGKGLAIRESGQFTGEMSLVSGNRPLVTARVTQDGAVLELTREKVLSLMAKDTEVGDINMGPLSHAVCWRFSLEGQRRPVRPKSLDVPLRSKNLMGIVLYARYCTDSCAAS